VVLGALCLAAGAATAQTIKLAPAPAGRRESGLRRLAADWACSSGRVCLRVYPGGVVGDRRHAAKSAWDSSRGSPLRARPDDRAQILTVPLLVGTDDENEALGNG
jgi:hypothetical protein